MIYFRVVCCTSIHRRHTRIHFFAQIFILQQIMRLYFFAPAYLLFFNELDLRFFFCFFFLKNLVAATKELQQILQPDF